MFNTLDQVDLEGKKVLLRTDLNSPIEQGEIQDNLRFEVYSKTIEELQNRGAKVIILAHQGRPHRDDFTTLKEHGKILSNYIEDIKYIDQIFSNNVIEKIENMENGEALLLENNLIKKVKTEKDKMRYDSNMESHHHLYDRESDVINDYYDEKLDELLKTHFKKKNIPDFKIEEIVMQINGKFN